jgi:hypothetical protein
MSTIDAKLGGFDALSERLAAMGDEGERLWRQLDESITRDVERLTPLERGFYDMLLSQHVHRGRLDAIIVARRIASWFP